MYNTWYHIQEHADLSLILRKSEKGAEHNLQQVNNASQEQGHTLFHQSSKFSFWTVCFHPSCKFLFCSVLFFLNIVHYRNKYIQRKSILRRFPHPNPNRVVHFPFLPFLHIQAIGLASSILRSVLETDTAVGFCFVLAILKKKEKNQIFKWPVPITLSA